MLMQWERFRGNRPDLSERKIDFVAPDPKAESDVGDVVRARGVGNVRDSEGGRLKKVWTDGGGRGVAMAETVGHAACVEFCKRRPAPDGTVSGNGGKNVS